MAERTGLEPATPCVTGRYSNQLNYRSVLIRDNVSEQGANFNGFSIRVKPLTNFFTFLRRFF